MFIKPLKNILWYKKKIMITSLLAVVAGKVMDFKYEIIIPPALLLKMSK